MPKRLLSRVLSGALTMLLVIGLAGIPRPAGAITWYAKLCVGFAECDERGYGNGGYSAVYKTSHWNMYSGNNCTNYVAYRLGQRGVPQFTIPGRGNAKYWGEHARNAGYAVDRTPRPGDVAWWYDMGSSGHVALVESVNLSAGTVLVSEDHWRGSFNWRTYRISDITGFLHVGAFASVESPPATTLVTAGTPTISGTAQVGEKLTAAPGDWESEVSFAYQWRRGKRAIAGATSSSYALVGADLGATITVRVTGSKAGYLAASGTSEATAPAAPGILKATPTPKIVGTPKVLKRLRVDAGAWAPSGVSLSYQWQRDGKAIKGATKSAYTLVDADLGARIDVRVRGAKAGYTSVTTASKATAAVGVADKVATPAARPKISGAARVGEKMTAKTGTWGPAPVKLTYQWLRDGKAIRGATKSAYALTADDLGAKIGVRVTGAKSEYLGASIASKATAKVEVGLLSATPTPRITGTAKVLKKLTAVPGAWAPSGVTLSYQWRRDGAAIKGATKPTYTLTADDLGAKISVKVTGKKRGYTSVSKTSASTVKAAAPDQVTAPSAAPQISGSALVGQELTANPGTWGPAPVKLTYQWLRGGVAIERATASTYTLVAEDKGAEIAVEVRGSKSGYTPVSMTSEATAVVE
ncbi:MAG TPA: CHAP domain-containing protein [Arachnia sp.]|nr:CHAP domain-containing protein [Arachnia sp.]HMR12368.1 CHAP domain-containing protein [Arachnia sp.]